MNDNNCVKVPFGKLTKAIKQTAFAVSKSEEKPILTGVKLEFDDNKLICTATDSRRLACKEIHIESGNNRIICCSKFKFVRTDKS